MKKGIGLIAATLLTTSVFSQDYDSSSASAQEQQTPQNQYDSSAGIDGAIHQPAIPPREGSESEGWSEAGTISGAGPGSVGESAATDTSTSNSANNFDVQVTGNAALNDRDSDLSARGLEPDSSELADQSSLNRAEADMPNDEVLIFEESHDVSVGGPGESESGAASSSSSSDSSGADSDYGQELRQRVQNSWSAQTGSDMPTAPTLFDRSLDDISGDKIYNGSSQSAAGAPGSSVSGESSSDANRDCDKEKDHQGAPAPYESEGRSRSDSAPTDYGDRPSVDDGHLTGNNAAEGSRSIETESDDSSVTPSED